MDSNAIEQAREKLIEEGMRSYLQATTAINAFEREIQKTCRQILENHIEDYADALGLRGALDCKESQGELSTTDDGLWREVGVAIRGKRFKSYVRWWGVYCTLKWQDQKCYTNVREYYYKSLESDELFQAMRKTACEIYDKKTEAGLWRAKQGVGLCQVIKAEEASRFEEPLERLLEQWIKLWKKVGGMKGVFK